MHATEILVVDDDLAFCSLIVRRLELRLRDLRPLFICVSSAEDAVSLAEKRREQRTPVPRLAILDANLTSGKRDGEEGVQLSEKLRDLAPDIRIVGLSSFQVSFGDRNVQKGPSKMWTELENAIRELSPKVRAAGAGK